MLGWQPRDDWLMSHFWRTLRGLLCLLYALQSSPSICSRVPHAPPPGGVLAHTTTTTIQLQDTTNRLRSRRLNSDDTIHLRAKETEIFGAPDAEEGDSFGSALAVHGNYTIFGAPDHYSGAVYVYGTADGGASWDFLHKLVRPDAYEFDDRGSIPEDYHKFGAAVAMDSDFIIVGSSWDSDIASRAGSVYIYNTSIENSTNPLVQKVFAPDSVAENRFGNAVAIDGKYMVVSARGDVGGSSPEAVYIYNRTDGGKTWNFVHKIVSPDPGDYMGFGSPVAIGGTCIVVGAKGRKSESGSVYIYSMTEDGESWVQVQKLVAVHSEAYAWFGSRLAIQGDIIAIASLLPAIDIYVRSEHNWTLSQTVVVSDDDSDGVYVAISANTMVIGATTYNNGGYDESIFIYRTTNSGRSWNFLQKIVKVTELSYCGSVVAIDDNVIAVGYPADDIKGLFVGGGASMYQLLNCANFTISDSWEATYEIRDAFSGDVVRMGSTALGTDGSDDICLADGCYTIEVDGANFTESSVWSFATLSGRLPFGPTTFVAIDGIISETMACSYQDFNSMNESTLPKSSNASTSSKGSSSANSVNGALMGGIVAAIVFIVILLGCSYWYHVVLNAKKADDCGNRIAVVTKMSKDTFYAGGGSYDKTRRGALRQRLLGTRTTIQALLAAGSTPPAFEVVLCTLQATLAHVEALLHKADDILAAGARIVSVVEVLQLLADSSTRLDTTTIERATVETCMHELEELVEDFGAGILHCSDRGWLRQKWILLANIHYLDLAALDAGIVTKLDDLLLAYNIARDQQIDKLLRRQTYVLEAAMKKIIDRIVTETGRDRQDVASELTENWPVTLAVANSAHIDDEELEAEFRSYKYLPRFARAGMYPRRWTAGARRSIAARVFSRANEDSPHV